MSDLHAALTALVDRHLAHYEDSPLATRCVTCGHAARHNELGYCQNLNCACSDGTTVAALARFVRRDLREIVEHQPADPKGPGVRLATSRAAFGGNEPEQWAVAVLDDGAEVRMRACGTYAEVRSWDADERCQPPALAVDRIGSHVIDVRPASADLPVATGDAEAEVCPGCAAFRARPSGGEPNWTCFTCGRDHVEEPSGTPLATSAAGSSPPAERHPHRIEEAPKVYLVLDERGQWGIDPVCFDGYPLDSAYDAPLHEACEIHGDNGCDYHGPLEHLVGKPLPDLPDAAALLDMLARALGKRVIG